MLTILFRFFLSHAAIVRRVYSFRLGMDSDTLITGIGDNRDDIESYLSVLCALDNLGRLPILGDLVNGVTEDDLDEEEASDNEISESDADQELSRWGHDLGTLLAYAAHYTAFACEGSAKVITSTHEYLRSGEVRSSSKHYLQVLRAGEVVCSWPLDAPVPVAELLAFCTPAHFGDLITQTTVLEPSVRTAMEIPVSRDTNENAFSYAM